MIYTKKACYSYPIYSYDSSDYRNINYNFRTEITDKSNSYAFKINFQIESFFINLLINEGYASVYCCIQSDFNFFSKISKENNIIYIPKNKISIDKSTKVQLFIKADRKISFSLCNELSPFFDEIKEDLYIDKDVLLGYSEVEKYNGEGTKPVELFAYTIKEDLDTYFKVELEDNIIRLLFNNKDFINQGDQMNMYLYVGLSRAIQDFYETNKNEDGDCYVSDDNQFEKILHEKLNDLFINKGVEEIYPENIDSIISIITDNLVKKYHDNFRRLINAD